jgi:hypothetical protein
MPVTPRELLDRWLARRVDQAGAEWLEDRCAHVNRVGPGADFFLAFSQAPRKVGRADLALGEGDVTAARDARPGWSPVFWSVDQAARTRLLIALPDGGAAALTTTLDQLCEDGDLGEQVAIYQSLPLLRYPGAHRARAAEGVRTNMKPVFEATALRNPYPGEQLDVPAWNQLVVKCLFVGSLLHHVEGLDARVNPELGGILVDWARERWAAGRPVSPEIWRCVGPVADGGQLADLGRAVATGSDIDRAAVALGAQHNPNAEGLLFAKARVLDAAVTRYPTWDAIVAAIPR